MNHSAQQALAVGIISGLVILTPAYAAAQASTATTQLLPPGGANCAALPVAGIAAHLSEGQLNSFDVTVANASYVAVLAQVGDAAVPFRYMTRFTHAGGFLRHHVDVDAVSTGAGVPVSLTLLSSPQGGPTCLSIISFTVASDGSILAPGMTNAPMKPVVTTPKGSSVGGAEAVAPSSMNPQATSSTSTVVSPIKGGGVARLSGLCDGNGALQLWFLLLAIYVVISAMTALAKPPLSQRSVWTPLALILVPLALLLGLWFLAPSCRAAGWIPAASIIVAVAALLVAFREKNPAIRVISLPAGKPATNTPAVAKSHAPAVSKPTTQEVKAVHPKGK